ncbi:MAG: hypothetical protein V1888_01555 [archaeon]
MVMGKRGAVDWTIGKLLNIVLLVIILVLIVYGMTSGGLVPLFENLGAKFDEVQILFGFEENFYQGCYASNVADLGGGPEFLKSLGIDGAIVSLNVCRDGVCNLSIGGVGEYRVVSGKIDKFVNGGWVRYYYYDKILAGKVNWERYNAGVDLLESSGLSDLYNGALTRKFVLFGDGNGVGENVTAVWQNGVWVIQENSKVARYFESDNEAIDAFVSFVDNVYDDKVFWGYDSMKGMNELFDLQGGVKNFVSPGGSDCSVYCGEGKFNPRPRGADSNYGCSYGTLRNNGACCCTWKDYGFDVVDVNEKNNWNVIGDYVGNEGSLSSYDELDSKKEVEVLKSRFVETKAMLLGESRISEESVLKMRELIGKKVLIVGVEYIVSLDESGYFPIVVFDSGLKKFGLELGAFSKVESELFGDEPLRYFPVYLVEFKYGEWVRVGDEQVYRLSKKKFDEAVVGDLIGKFLRSKCL